MGAGIEGKADVGYVLKPGFLLPPLMFTPDEIKALVLGSRWVANHVDDRVSDAARSALSRIAAVLRANLRNELDGSTLLVGSGATVVSRVPSRRRAAPHSGQRAAGQA